MISKSTWELDVADSYPELDRNLETDVAVVGGGLAGILVAYFLSKAGKNIVLLEAGSLGSGATMYTTALITKDIDTNVSDLEKMLGTENAKRVWESGQIAIEKFEEIILGEKIECEFERADYNILAFSVADRKRLYEQMEVLDRWKEGVELVEHPNFGFETQGSICVPRQAKFHPVKFLKQLAAKNEEYGAKIFEHTEVKEIKEENKIISVITNKAVVKAEKVVVATYEPIVSPIQLFLKKGRYKTYMVEALIPKNILKNGMYVDMHNPYFYFRVDEIQGMDRVILGGEDHRSEIKIEPARSYEGLENYLAKLIGIKNFKIIRRWGGPILEPSDGLALIGEYDPNKYVATAFSGNGVTYGMIAGMLISDLILERPNDWKKIYDPKRIPSLMQLLIKGRDYTGEFVNGAWRKIFKWK